MPNNDDFMKLRNRNAVRDWGWDGERDAIAADSSMMIDRSRVKTEPHWEENPQWKKMVKKNQRVGTPIDYNVPSGKFVDKPCDLMEHVKESMGSAVRGTIYKNPQKKKNNGENPRGY